MEEIWKPIKGLEGHYEVSNTGKVKGLHSGKTLKPYVTNCGYSMIHLCYGNKTIKAFSIHRLVAEAFIPNPENKAQVNHIDGNKSNNNVTNLEWMTPKENTVHACKTGLRNCSGSNHHNAKLSEEDAKEIKRLYQKNSKEYGYRALAKKYGVHHRTIFSVIHGRTWVNV